VLSAIVVDDVQANREVARLALARIGAEVREAASGEEAIRLVRERRPDVLLLDVRMPELSGPETLRRLEVEGLRAGIRIVAVSASALDHERQAGLAAGFDDFLVKPLELERLYACLADLLDLTFEYELPLHEVGTEVEDPLRSAMALPEPVRHALRSAAGDFNVTDLKKALEMLDALGDDFRPLAQELQRMSRRYDMEGIVQALNETPSVSHA
jgi:CheY-like chemotaxis protein